MSHIILCYCELHVNEDMKRQLTSRILHEFSVNKGGIKHELKCEIDFFVASLRIMLYNRGCRYQVVWSASLVTVQSAGSFLSLLFPRGVVLYFYEFT